MTREDMVMRILGALVKQNGGEVRVPKADADNLARGMVLDVTEDPETGDVVVRLRDTARN